MHHSGTSPTCALLLLAGAPKSQDCETTEQLVASRSALYSVPSTTCPPGTTVDVQLTAKVVRIYHQNTLIKVHRRTHRGGRATDYSDYPQELTPYTARGPDNTQRRAAELGEHVGAFATRLFEGPLPWSTLR